MEENKKTNLKFNILAIFLIIIFAFSVSQKTLQNDTFYTIKIGEHILNNGIDMKDPFSWHDISYTYPHWAYDIIIYLIYSLGGHLGIYLSTICFASILGIILFFTNDKFTKNKSISFVLTIGALYILKDFIAARAQLFTFILFALEILFIENFLDTGKKRYVFGLLIIPIVLANAHVAVFPFYFILYLPYIVEYIIAMVPELTNYLNKRKVLRLEKKISKVTKPIKLEKLTKKLGKARKQEQHIYKIDNEKTYKIKITNRPRTKQLIIIMIICIFAGLLTPLKGTPYTYLIKTMQGNSTKNISEHLPLTLAHNIIYAVVLLFYITILTFTDTKIRLCDLFMLAGLTVLTFMSRRQESMFIVICIPIFNRLVTSFLEKYDKDGIEQMKDIMTNFFGAFITIGIVLIISIICYNNRYKDSYISENSYPVKASEWILDNLDLENIKLYNEYNYGSYLLFKDIPVFIDSRADLYLPEFNDGVKVFDDFLTISNLSNFKIDELFEKYGFTHFITNSNAKLRIYLDAKPEEYKVLYNDNNFYIYEKIGE